MKAIFKKLVLIVTFIITHSLVAYSFFNDYYVRNMGQWNGKFQFLAKGNGYNLLVEDRALCFDYYTIESRNGTTIKHGHNIKFELKNSSFLVSNLSEPSPWKLSFFYGNNSKDWVTDVQGYKQIRFKDIYPQIDLVLKFEMENPRYDFVIKPGGNPKDILIQVSGAYSVTTDGMTLKYQTRFGEVVNTNLFAYQNVDDAIVQIPCRFIQKDETLFSFDIGNYDKSRELIIDPIVMMSYFGGSINDRIIAIKELTTGILLATGWTESLNFPTTEGAYDNSYNDLRDVFICKFDLRGAKRTLIYGTFFGGAGTDYPSGLSVDENNNVYIGGTTNSTDFPLKNPINNANNGGYDAFITKFSPELNTIVYSTYVGGNKDDISTTSQLGPDKGFYVCGYTESTNLPATGGAIQTKLKGRKDIFIIKLTPSGQLVDYCTYIGGGDDDIPYAMAISEVGNIFITGTTKSSDFPMAPYRTQSYGNQTIVTESPYDRTYNGGWDAFAIKLLGDGGKLDFSTYFGGTADDIGTAVTYTSDQKIIFAGITYKETTNPSFPISQNAYQTTHKGGVDIFIAGLSNIITSTGGWGLTYKRQDLDFSTFLGGSSNEYPTSLLLSGKFLHIFGHSNSTNFPVVNNPGGKKIGKYDIFYLQMNSDGSSVNFSDIFGTTNDDSCSATYFAPNGDFYVAGLTNSKSLTLVNPIPGTSSQAPNSIMLMKYSNLDLRFDYPVGKEKICPNSNLIIKWNSETLTNKDTFDIDIKIGSSDVWTPLAQKVVGFSYTWNIPPTFFADSAWLRISHLRGIITTTPYPFTIYELPTIVESKSIPTNTIVCEGDSVVLIMKGKGSNIKYQWLFNGSPIPGATDTILIIRNIDATKKGQYKGIISGPCPETVETPIFNVNFLPSTKILAQTNDTIVKKSEKLHLYVYAVGDNLSYQWYKDDERLIGANESTFEIQSVSILDEGIFKCKVVGTCGELFSQPIKVEVDTTVIPSKVDENLLISSYVTHDNILIINLYQKNEIPSFINIYNALGQLVNPNLVQKEYSNARVSLNLENLQSGIYFVEFAINQKMFRLRVPVVR